jgi:ABC-type uncharacterized transport system involved in gliding motility auxiliary subunit
MGLFNFGKKKETFFLDLSASEEPSSPDSTLAAPPEATTTPAPEAQPQTSARKGAKAKAVAESPAVVSEEPVTVIATEPVVEAVAVVITNFATDYLMPSGTPRRSPGPSLKQFMSMAEEMRR